MNNQTRNNTTIITVYASLHHFIGYKWDQPRICKDTRQLQTTPCPALIPIVGEKPEKLFFKKGGLEEGFWTLERERDMQSEKGEFYWS